MGNSRNKQPGRLYTSLVDVGNRVHTRNDSDEDVRGYACNQAIALWLYLGLSLFKHSLCCKTQASIYHGLALGWVVFVVRVVFVVFKISSEDLSCRCR